MQKIHLHLFVIQMLDGGTDTSKSSIDHHIFLRMNELIPGSVVRKGTVGLIVSLLPNRHTALL